MKYYFLEMTPLLYVYSDYKSLSIRERAIIAFSIEDDEVRLFNEYKEAYYSLPEDTKVYFSSEGHGYLTLDEFRKIPMRVI